MTTPLPGELLRNIVLPIYPPGPQLEPFPLGFLLLFPLNIVLCCQTSEVYPILPQMELWGCRGDFSIQGQASSRQSDPFASKSNHLLAQPLSLSCTWTYVPTALLLSSWLEIIQVLSVLPHPFHGTHSTRERQTWKDPSRKEPDRETG